MRNETGICIGTRIHWETNVQSRVVNIFKTQVNSSCNILTADANGTTIIMIILTIDDSPVIYG